MLIKSNELLFLIFLCCAIFQLLRNVGKHLDYNYKIIPMLSIKKYTELPVISLCLSTFIDEVKFQKRYPGNLNWSLYWSILFDYSYIANQNNSKSLFTNSQS